MFRGDFVFEDRRWDSLQIRIRGGYGRNYAKKSWKINFNSSDRFFGTDKINLNSEFFDAYFT
jgi:hypothetical protein